MMTEELKNEIKELFKECIYEFYEKIYNIRNDINDIKKYIDEEIIKEYNILLEDIKIYYTDYFTNDI